MFGNRKKLADQLQKQGGTVAWATILAANNQWQSSSSGVINQSPHVTDHVKVSVRVEPDGGAPFEQTFHQAFPGQAPIAGWQCKVIYDPEDSSKIAMLEDSITPPGISHDRAERGAAIRAEAMQAVASGNLGEFVEKMRARAVEQGGGAQVFINGQPLVLGGSAAQPASALAAEPPQPDIADQLAKLASLHEQGVLTDEEFSAAKAKLLAAG